MTITNCQKIASLYNLPEFLTHKDNLLVIVPKIQRSYAQGRTSEQHLRDRFLRDIFKALNDDTPLELSFIYGSIFPNENDSKIRFELLDGQQRVTTMLLLYWYIACAENMDIPEYLKDFTYETRASTTTFLKELMGYRLGYPFYVLDQKPSWMIRNRKWYHVVFDKDSSIKGMLTMLDTIHDLYKKSPSKGNLFGRLNKIKFYELPLDNFGLSEEIYIKMNARGLQLTPFENFKADLVKFIKDHTQDLFPKEIEIDAAGKPFSVPYYQYLSQKLDNQWIDIFWHPDRSGYEYCARYFRFFYRYFAGKLFLDEQNDKSADSYRPNTDEIWDFFWEESKKQDKIYFGFEYYETLLKKHPHYIEKIEIILEWFSNPDYVKLLDELNEPWNLSDSKQCWNHFEETYSIADAIRFTAVCEYIERNGSTFNDGGANFKKWLRIVRNVIAGSLLRNVSEYISLSRNLVELLKLPHATSDIYAALANLDDFWLDSKDMTRAFREAVKKAKIIIQNPQDDWEKAFMTAESHPLFEGSIAFLLHNLPAKASDFNKRAQLVGKLFDKNGIVEECRENHRLIRALIHKLVINPDKETNDNGILPKSKVILTERNDDTRHLRSFLLEKEAAAKFLCEMGDGLDLQDLNSFYHYLDNYYLNPAFFNYDEIYRLYPHRDLATAYIRLCLDPIIYDFIYDIDKHKKTSPFVFMDRNIDKKTTLYSVDYPGSSVARIYIGKDRRNLITTVLHLGYKFCRKEDQEFFNKYKDVRSDYTWNEDYAINYKGKWLQYDLGHDHFLKIAIHADGRLEFFIDAEDGLLNFIYVSSRKDLYVNCIKEININNSGENILIDCHQNLLNIFKKFLRPLAITVADKLLPIKITN